MREKLILVAKWIGLITISIGLGISLCILGVLTRESDIRKYGSYVEPIVAGAAIIVTFGIWAMITLFLWMFLFPPSTPKLTLVKR